MAHRSIAATAAYHARRWRPSNVDEGDPFAWADLHCNKSGWSESYSAWTFSDSSILIRRYALTENDEEIHVWVARSLDDIRLGAEIINQSFSGTKPLR